MRQIVYTSISTAAGDKADLDGILEQSRHNNALDGITGLLWSDRTHFAQVLEGPATSMEATFARIVADPRHRDLKVQLDVEIDEREFGDWTMVHRRARDPVDRYDVQMRRLLGSASPSVQRPFLVLMAPGNLPLANAGLLPA